MLPAITVQKEKCDIYEGKRTEEVPRGLQRLVNPWLFMVEPGIVPQQNARLTNAQHLLLGQPVHPRENKTKKKGSKQTKSSPHFQNLTDFSRRRQGLRWKAFQSCLNIQSAWKCDNHVSLPLWKRCIRCPARFFFVFLSPAFVFTNAGMFFFCFFFKRSFFVRTRSLKTELWEKSFQGADFQNSDLLFAWIQETSWVFFFPRMTTSVMSNISSCNLIT